MRTKTRGTVIGGGENVSLIPQVSMARDRRTNNPSTSTFMHTKNRPVILLVNLQSWYEHPQGLSVQIPRHKKKKTLCLDIMFVFTLRCS